ncbi:Uncharacterised protein [Mycobacteroides abscessus subsp. abscessus]|nr:Uncharacterised protein [Mycobacteroides abscessus subsp. abscessus]
MANPLGHDRGEGAGVEDGPPRGTHTELVVEQLGRIADDRERQLDPVAAQFVIAGVEHHHLTDAGRGDLVVTPRHRLKVHVADRAAREATQLQMDKAVGIRDAHRLSGYGDQFPGCHHSARADDVGFSHEKYCLSESSWRARK